MHIGCNTIEEEFENRSKSSTLKLYENSNYAYKFPHFLGYSDEKGTYSIQDTNLILTRKELNIYPEKEFSSSWWHENPGKLKFSFDNLNREKIDVDFRIKENSEKYSTISGELEITYAELEDNGMISSNGQVTNLIIEYKDETYKIDSMNMENGRRPTHFDITLNEFKNNQYAILRRNYVIKNNAILMNDINVKNLGTRNRYLLKKKIR